LLLLVLLFNLSFRRLSTDRSSSRVIRPDCPIRLALITARNSPAHERVLKTLRAWQVRIDEMFFLGGAPKDPVLRAFQPHIFFDDRDAHCVPAARVAPTAQVPSRL